MMTHKALPAYVDELSIELEIRGAKGHLINDVLRQVESHTHETREDPYETFGKPGDYASEFAPHSRMNRTWFWVIIAASVIPAFGGGLLLTNGIINVGSDDTILWGINAWFGVMCGIIVLVAWALTLVLFARSDQ